MQKRGERDSGQLESATMAKAASEQVQEAQEVGDVLG
jgi:hypothetical protein